MSQKSWFKLSVVAVFMFSVSILVNNAYAVDSLKGKGSLAASMSIQHQEMSMNDSESETDTTSIMGSVGYFFTDHMEVNFAPMIMRTEPDEGDETTLYSYFGNLKYNFYQKGWTNIPYIGVQSGITGYESEGESDSAFSYGGMVGAKFFLTEDVSLNAELNYLHTTFELDDDNDLDLDVTSLFIGFTYYFGGK